MINKHEKLTELFQLKRSVRYFPIYVQLILSILVAHYLCAPQSFFSMKGKWDDLLYWIVMGISVVIAMVIFTFAQWLHRRMDHKQPWLPHFCKRMRSQILLGVLAPMGIILVLMYLIVGVGMDQGIRWFWGYAESYSLHLFILILIMNLIYLSWYMWAFAFFAAEQLVLEDVQMESLKIQLERQRKLTDDESPILMSLRVYHGYKELTVPVADIAYFKSADGKRYCTRFEGDEQYEFQHTLDELLPYLDANQFCKVNRRYIVHRNSIARHEPIGNGRIGIILKEGIQDDDMIIVSRELAAEVKAWLSD